MANLLQSIGNAQPVSQFIDTALKYQTVQSQMETQKMQQQLLQQQVLQSEKDNKEYAPEAVLSLYPEHARPHIMEAWKMGGVIDPATGMIRGADVRKTPDFVTGNQKVSEALLTAEYERLAKKNASLATKQDAASQQEALDNVAQMTAIEKARRLGKDSAAKDKFKPVVTAKGIVSFNEGTGEAGEPFAEAPPTGGGVDPSVVRTFEAAHPELVPLKGTTEYGQALEAFIKSGERPYSTFVGLTPDGKQAITFDSRKGTVGLQPLPFQGQIQPKISPTIPTEQTTAFQQIGTLKEALGQVTKMYDDSFVGPIAGPVGKIQDNWGIMPDAKRAEFRALTANLYNTIIYLRSGKQINEEEAKRLLDELPTPNVSPTGFKAKLKKFTWELNSIESGRLKQLKGAGYRNVGEAQGAPSGPTVMEKRTLPNGQVWESLSDGTFRQVK